MRVEEVQKNRELSHPAADVFRHTLTMPARNRNVPEQMLYYSLSGTRVIRIDDLHPQFCETDFAEISLPLPITKGRTNTTRLLQMAAR